MSEESWLISHVKDKTELCIGGNMKHQDQRKFHSTVLTISRSSWGRKRKFSNLDPGDVKIKMFWHRSSSSRAVSYWSPHTSTYTKVRILVQHCLRNKYFKKNWLSTRGKAVCLCVLTRMYFPAVLLWQTLPIGWFNISARLLVAKHHHMP